MFLGLSRVELDAIKLLSALVTSFKVVMSPSRFLILRVLDGAWEHAWPVSLGISLREFLIKKSRVFLTSSPVFFIFLLASILVELMVVTKNIVETTITNKMLREEATSNSIRVKPKFFSFGWAWLEAVFILLYHNKLER